jgi:hypothetical protein
MSKAQPGSGYGFTSSGYGFTLNMEQPFAASETTKIRYLYAKLNGDKVSVSPGTVNRYIPQIGSTYLDAATPPTITVEGAGYVCVKATYEANKFFPRTATIVYEYGATPPADTETNSYYPLARVNADGSAYTMIEIASGNLVVNRLKAGAGIATWWWDVID